MFLYEVKSGNIKEVAELETISGEYVAIMDTSEIDNMATFFNIDPKLAEEVGKSAVPKLESYAEIDYIYLYDITDNFEKEHEYWLFLKKQGLVLVCENSVWFKERFIKLVEIKSLGYITVEKFTSIFLNQLVLDDLGLVKSLEEEIEVLEENILTSEPKAVNAEIIVMKKRLLYLRHYYEQLLDVAYDIEENVNDIIRINEMNGFRLFTGRVERITRSIIMLRDYLTQVREAHQAQEDIKLNSSMELFTVITAIFLPLTLLTSWYGMNFENMPELGLKYGYFCFLLVTVVMVIAMLYYLKKRKKSR